MCVLYVLQVTLFKIPNPSYKSTVKSLTVKQEDHIKTWLKSHRCASYTQIRTAGQKSTAGVPNISPTMYPFSISTEKYVPLQYFHRCTCTPKISYDNTFYHDYSLIYLTIII